MSLARRELAGEAPIVVLCSGGRDSVCLLDVVLRLRAAAGVTVVHVNYGLRGDDSEADDRHVRELCSDFGVRLEVVRAHRPDRGNLQAWAREVRYEAAERHMGLIATGHTANDQAETVLYRLVASPGRRALLGMRPRDGRRVRPLLSVTREQTAAYCRERGLAWREDASNGDTAFARARVRRVIADQLEQVHPAAVRNIARTAELLREEGGLLELLVDETLAGADRIELARLAALPPPLARLVVRRLAEGATRGPVPIGGERIDELIALGGRGGSVALDLGASARAVIEYGVLRVERPGPVADEPPAVTLPVPGSATFGAWRLDCRLAGDHDRAGIGRLEAALDGAVAERGLEVRAWRAGDRVRPVGLGGTKSLADLFGERRVPRAERGRVPVVVCENTIAWVPGVVTAEPFAAHGAGSVAILRAARRD